MPSPDNLVPVRVRASDESALQNCLGLTPLTFFSIIINSLHFELETANFTEWMEKFNSKTLLSVQFLGFPENIPCHHELIDVWRTHGM